MLGPLFYVGHANSAQFRSKLIKLCHPMQTLANWPPKVPGACKWWAHLQGNTLIIARDKPLPEEGSHSGKGAAASQAHGHETEDALIVREIDLQGCRQASFPTSSSIECIWHCHAPRPLPDRHMACKHRHSPSTVPFLIVLFQDKRRRLAER